MKGTRSIIFSGVILLLICSSYQSANGQSSDQITIRHSAPWLNLSSTISADSIDESQFENISELLQGKVPGLVVTKPGSNPSGDYTLRLRGVSSIESRGEPLVVVDGVPGLPLNQIPPFDLKSVRVLKHASASALYGVRGAAGVILVDTKSGPFSSFGKSQTFDIRYRGHSSIQSMYRPLDVLEAAQFRSQTTYNEKSTGYDYSEYLYGNSTNWISRITDRAFSHSHSISASGGWSNTHYRASLNYRNREGILKTTRYENLRATAGIKQQLLNNNLLLHLNFSGGQKDLAYGFHEAFQYASTFNPTAPVYDNNSEWGGYFQQKTYNTFNPVAMLEQNQHHGFVERIGGTARATYNFDNLVSGLQASIFYGDFYSTHKETEFHPSDDFWVGQNSDGFEQIEKTGNRNRTARFSFSLNRSLNNNLNLNTSAGYFWQQFTSDIFEQKHTGFGTDSEDIEEVDLLSDFEEPHKLAAYFARFHLNFKETYSLAANVRREGSSRFGINNKWGTFWGLQGDVELSNLFDTGFFQQLNFHIGYGVTGQDLPENGLSLWLFGPTGGKIPYKGEWIDEYGTVNNPNHNLKWEEKQEVDFGINFATSKNILSGGIDLYFNRSKDLLLNYQVPVPPYHHPALWLNIGEIKNRGLELFFNLQPIRTERFSWNIGMNFVKQRRPEVGSFSNDSFDFEDQESVKYSNGANGLPGCSCRPTHIVKEGEAMGQIFAPKFLRISDGEMILKDQNQDGLIGLEDYISVGNGIPTGFLGLQNSVTFKGWDLSVDLRGVFGHDLLNMHRAAQEIPQNVPIWNVLKSALEIKRLEEFPQYSSYYIENASFVSLDRVTLGRSFQIGDNSGTLLRVYLSGKNLFYITGYSGPVPEPRFTGKVASWVKANPLLAGIDQRNAWYPARTYMLGVDVSF
jgi:iron complex outermembrane receptor protein